MTDLAERTALPTRLKVSVETITPELAQVYLANMDNPRKLRDAVVKRYARDMANGDWHIGTSAISFDARGVLRDGQHRLQACIDSGVPLETVVYRGVGEGAVLNMDRGLKRAWSDVLKARGVPNSANVQSAVVLSWRWDHGLFTEGSARYTATNSELEAWLADHPEFIDCVHEAVLLRRDIGCKVSAMAAFIHRTQVIDPEASALMVEMLKTGDVPPANPIRKLRDRTMVNANRSRGGALAQIVDLAVCCKAWNAWITGRQIQLLSWRRGPSVRESFPDLVEQHGSVWPFPDVVARMEGGDE